LRTTRASTLFGNPSSSFLAEGFTSTTYLATKSPTLDQVCLDFPERYALFLSPLLGNEAIPKILQPDSVLFQVN
jgi:hypothetical protein